MVWCQRPLENPQINHRFSCYGPLPSSVRAWRLNMQSRLLNHFWKPASPIEKKPFSLPIHMILNLCARHLPTNGHSWLSIMNSHRFQHPIKSIPFSHCISIRIPGPLVVSWANYIVQHQRPSTNPQINNRFSFYGLFLRQKGLRETIWSQVVNPFRKPAYLANRTGSI